MSAPGAGMAADMAAQPATLAALIDARDGTVRALRSALPPAPAGAVIVARGSSDYAAVFGRYIIESAIRRPVALAAPSLLTVYGDKLELGGWLAIGVSQSGRTPEVATVLSAYAAAGAHTVAITNGRESTLARAADVVVELRTGIEAAVPATKTFTAELVAFAMIAEALGRTPFPAGEWSALPGTVARILADPEPADRAAARLGDAAGLACVARGYLLCIALESALKLREAAGLRAEGWSAADFRHGPVTVAGGDLPLLTVSADGPAAGDRAQQLALSLARHRGLDPDRPPGLAKVTRTI